MRNEAVALERKIVAGIIRSIHNGTRIADSGQRELHITVRNRIREDTNINIRDAEVGELIAKYSERLHSEVPAKSRKGKAVVRKSMIDRLRPFFENVWPFGS
jgi:hypothetical protein